MIKKIKLNIFNVKSIWTASWRNQQNDLCAQRRPRSAWASVWSVFTVRMKNVWVLSYPLSAQRRRSARASTQADQSSLGTVILLVLKYEPQNSKTNKMTCPVKTDQPGHRTVWCLRSPPEEATRKAHREDWSDQANAQTDLSLQSAHKSVCRFCSALSCMWATSWENLLYAYANNKGAVQPAHPRSLISTFVVHCLDSIISLVSILAISKL